MVNQKKPPARYVKLCLSACLPVCLSACLPVCLSACLPVSHPLSLLQPSPHTICQALSRSLRAAVPAGAWALDLARAGRGWAGAAPGWRPLGVLRTSKACHRLLPRAARNPLSHPPGRLKATACPSNEIVLGDLTQTILCFKRVTTPTIIKSEGDLGSPLAGSPCRSFLRPSQPLPVSRYAWHLARASRKEVSRS